MMPHLLTHATAIASAWRAEHRIRPVLRLVDVPAPVDVGSGLLVGRIASGTAVRLQPTAPAAARPAPDPLLGLAAGDAPVRLGAKDGHLLAVTGDGYGATSLLRTLGAQLAAAGVPVDILDVAYQHGWAHQIPHATVHGTPPAIATFLQQRADDIRGTAGAGPRRVVLVENDLAADVLNSLRTAEPAPGTGGTPVLPSSPLEDLIAVLAHGLPHGTQVVLACRQIPGPLRAAARDLFATRLLHAPATSTWTAVGVGRHRGALARRPGRYQLVREAAAPTAVQALHLTDQQAAVIAAFTTPTSARSPR